MKKHSAFRPLQNNSGLIIADFLFSFVLVIGVGIFIFGITFSLATIEIGQYIVWSAAHNYSTGNIDKVTAETTATDKFNNLSAQFPLLTNGGWFELSDLIISDNLAASDSSLTISAEDQINDYRQPWTGVSAKINLKLFSSLKVPFLGKVADDPSLFKFPVRAFLIRHPSKKECRDFFSRRFTEGIKKLEDEKLTATINPLPPAPADNAITGEDNGC